MDFLKHGATADREGERPCFRFDDEDGAQDFFNEWYTALLKDKIPAEEEAIMKEHLSKYGKLMPALALLIHLLNMADPKVYRMNPETYELPYKPSGSIPLICAQQAAKLCDYLESHARRIYGMGTNSVYQSSKKLIQKIKEGKLKDLFTARDVANKDWSFLEDSDTARKACENLIELGWLREVPVVSGCRRTVGYLINPKVKIKREH